MEKVRNDKKRWKIYIYQNIKGRLADTIDKVKRGLCPFVLLKSKTSPKLRRSLNILLTIFIYYDPTSDWFLRCG